VDEERLVGAGLHPLAGDGEGQPAVLAHSTDMGRRHRDRVADLDVFDGLAAAWRQDRRAGGEADDRRGWLVGVAIGVGRLRLTRGDHCRPNHSPEDGWNNHFAVMLVTSTCAW